MNNTIHFTGNTVVALKGIAIELTVDFAYGVHPFVFIR